MISIVIPVLNAKETIGRCLDSLLCQAGEFEILVCDGGSNDGTIEIIESYTSDKIRIVSEEDRGQADAILKGFAAAQGTVLGWLCADDAMEPGAFEFVVTAFEDVDLQLFVGACRRTYDDGHVHVVMPTQEQFDNIALINCFDQPSVFWTKELFQRVGGLSQSFRLAFDWDLWNRFKAADVTVQFTDAVLSNYYFSNDNLTSCNPQLSRKEASRVIELHGPMGEAVARLYNYMYETFDLTGFLDNPKQARRAIRKDYEAFMKHAVGIFGEGIVYSYNWNWISRQERDLTWR